MSCIPHATIAINSIKRVSFRESMLFNHVKILFIPEINGHSFSMGTICKKNVLPSERVIGVCSDVRSRMRLRQKLLAHWRPLCPSIIVSMKSSNSMGYILFPSLSYAISVPICLLVASTGIPLLAPATFCCWHSYNPCSSRV